MRASLLPTRMAHQSVRQLPTLCSNNCTGQRRIEQNSAHRPLIGFDTSRSGTGHGSQFLPQAQAVAVDERSEPSGEPVKNAEELVAAALRRADQAMQAWMAQPACVFFCRQIHWIQLLPLYEISHRFSLSLEEDLYRGWQAFGFLSILCTFIMLCRLLRNRLTACTSCQALRNPARCPVPNSAVLEDADMLRRLFTLPDALLPDLLSESMRRPACVALLTSAPPVIEVSSFLQSWKEVARAGPQEEVWLTFASLPTSK